MRTVFCFPVLCVFFVCCGFHLQAQVVPDTLPELTLEQLLQLQATGGATETEQVLNARIEAASQRPFSTRETPNVVTVISAEEIRNSGARDLMDVLRLVPGIEFGTDVEGVVSIGVRGQWAAEGKVLVAVDGVEQNEMLYGAYSFGNEFPISVIKRVEVIRGPGSVINGGFAALGVINIITKDALDETGLTVHTTTGSTQTGFSRATANLSYRTITRDNWRIGVRGSIGTALRSDQVYRDLFGGSYNMRDYSDMNRRDVGVNLTGYGLQVVLQYRFYSPQTRAPVDSVYSNLNSEIKFDQYRASVNWNRKFAHGWSVSTGFTYSYDRPWRTFAPLRTFTDYDRSISRTRFNGAVQHTLTRQVSIAFGFQASIDQGKANIDSLPFEINDSIRFNIRSQAVFGELTWKTYWFNLIAGARAEYNTEAGSAIVPRVALTKNFDRFSIKLLANESFKTPTMENINLQTASGIDPELVFVAELEVGYKIGRRAYLSANGFRTDIQNPIIYLLDNSTDDEFYVNSTRQLAWGAEAEFLFRDSLWQVRANWSFYSVRGEEQIELYSVPENTNLLLNFPQHKVSFSVTRLLAMNWRLNATGNLVSARYLYTGINLQGDYVMTRFKPDALLAVTLNRVNVLPGMDLSVSIHNLLNRQYVIGQPYFGDLGPVSSLSREFLVQLTWHPTFN